MSLRKDRGHDGTRARSGSGAGVRAPLRRVLIANRGEIAVRISRACRELGIETIAVHSDADIDAPHVRAADVAVRIGPAPAAESYLVAERLLDAALAHGADAVHPGYGFLSERSDFAQACEEAGLIFIGPTPGTLAALGDKLAARRSARAVGVPTVPGSFHPLPVATPEHMQLIEAEAAAIGWPLLVKAAAGGGGRGMRRVDRPEELATAIASAGREAASAFGDGSVYLERLVEGGRHVEVQLLGDGAGQVVALGERDCSVQRRYQKLAEEAPAPGLTPEKRRRLQGLAATVAATIGLRSAATAEFLLAPDGEIYFLEVNARLQVEHGVTELVTGLDLVHEQLRIAGGDPLSELVHRAAERVTAPEAHAIEVRISAEDPSRDFAPMPGVVTRWREPGGPGVRVDSGVEEGSTVTPDYDPLLAKLLVVASDRSEALARLRRALHEFVIAGVQTTLPFHRWLVELPDFREARLRTDLVARSWQPAPIRERAAREAARAVARHVFQNEGSLGTPSSGRRREVPDGADHATQWRMTARREAVERWP